MKLDTYVQSKVRWHLGYNLTSVPAGDQARLEEAMNNIQDSFWYDKIVEQISRCDEAEKRTDMTGSVNNDSVPKSRIESILGDVDRTISTSDFKETLNRLALHLYVPNYRNPEQARYRFNREGAEFIQALPGPADIAVGTRLLLESNYR
jgi:hypothetical protein